MFIEPKQKFPGALPEIYPGDSMKSENPIFIIDIKCFVLYYVAMREDLKKKFVLLSKVARERKYAQEYLSLLARRGDLSSIRIGKRWYTKNEWMEDFIRENHKRKDFAKKAKLIVDNPEKEIEIEKTSALSPVLKERKVIDPVPILIKSEVRKPAPNVYEFSDAGRIQMMPVQRKADFSEKRPVFIRRAGGHKNNLAENRVISTERMEAGNFLREVRPRVFRNQPREKEKQPLPELRKFSSSHQEAPHDARLGMNSIRISEHPASASAPEPQLPPHDSEFVHSGFTSPDFASLARPQKRLSLQFAFLAVSVLVFFLLIQITVVSRNDLKTALFPNNEGKVAGAISNKSEDENSQLQDRNGPLEALATANNHLDNADSGMKENFSFLHLMARAALEKKTENEPVGQ